MAPVQCSRPELCETSSFRREVISGRSPLFLQAEGAAYQPWLTVRNVRSRGRKSRIAGHTVSRVHHLFSDLETKFFLLADFAQAIVDIREQFPLLPLDLTMQIAEQMGVRHPWDRKSGELTVMTTDFVLTRLDQHNRPSYHAYSVKPSEIINTPGRRQRRTLEKLEIERRLWTYFDVPWTLVTEQSFDPIVIQNLQWLSYGARAIPANLLLVLPQFLRQLSATNLDHTTLSDLLETLSGRLGLSSQGDAQRLFCHSVWKHHIQLDLNRAITLSQPIGPIHVAQFDSAHNELDPISQESLHG